MEVFTVGEFAFKCCNLHKRLLSPVFLLVGDYRLRRLIPQAECDPWVVSEKWPLEATWASGKTLEPIGLLNGRTSGGGGRTSDGGSSHRGWQTNSDFSVLSKVIGL